MTTMQTMVADRVTAMPSRDTRGGVPLYRPREPEEDDPAFGPRQRPPMRPCHKLTFNKAVRIAPDRPAPARCDAKGRTLPFHDDMAALSDHGSLGMLPPRS
jgi:hypothetical protein